MREGNVMARETTSDLIGWADITGEWETVARLCLEWMEELDVRSMVEHHGILNDEDNE